MFKTIFLGTTKFGSMKKLGELPPNAPVATSLPLGYPLQSFL